MSVSMKIFNNNRHCRSRLAKRVERRFPLRIALLSQNETTYQKRVPWDAKFTQRHAVSFAKVYPMRSFRSLVDSCSQTCYVLFRPCPARSHCADALETRRCVFPRRALQIAPFLSQSVTFTIVGECSRSRDAKKCSVANEGAGCARISELKSTLREWYYVTTMNAVRVAKKLLLRVWKDGHV